MHLLRHAVYSYVYCGADARHPYVTISAESTTCPDCLATALKERREPNTRCLRCSSDLDTEDRYECRSCQPLSSHA